MRYVYLEDDDTWSFFLNKVKFGSIEDRTNGLAKFDFTSDWLTVPRNTFQSLKSAYGGNIERFYCQSYRQSKSIVVTTYGQNISIDVSNFIIPLINDPKYCELKILQAAQIDENQIVFGKQVLKQYCITLDFDEYEIGFAESNKTE